MRKGKDIIGKPIVSYDTGEKCYKVEDLIFDQDSNRLLGFLVDEAGWFSDAQVILLNDVQAIGLDAVIIPSKSSVIKAREVQVITRILEHNNILKGTRILTTDGRDLGTLVDLYFDDRTGVVEGYEASGGLFADVYSGRSFVPAPQTLKIGEDFAFVPVQTAELMAEQVGGIKAAVQTASEKVQETAQATGEKVQELGQAATEKAQQTAQATGEKLQELGQVASEKVQEAAQATGEKLQQVQRSTTASITNVIVDPAEQKAFVVGRTAMQSVTAPGGGELVIEGQVVTQLMADSADYMGVLDELYRATGGSVSDKLSGRVENTVAAVTVDQSLGQRVHYLVQTNEGFIVAAPGQIVTEHVVEWAKLYHQEQALLRAVGLSMGDAVRDKTSQVVGVTGDRLKSATDETGAQLRSGAAGLWGQVKETAHELQGRSANLIQEKRIKGALGRPASRVILDPQDEVILNVGELITHEAIANARDAGVLDLLLDSVYTDKPQLSLGDLRAPVSGKAAL
jgi:uncharacterized protein YrrD